MKEVSSSEKEEITFESEGNLFEEISASVRDITSIAESDNPAAPYLLSFMATFKFFDQIYHRNVRLLEMIQEMNTTVVSNASKIQAIFMIVLIFNVFSSGNVKTCTNGKTNFFPKKS